MIWPTRLTEAMVEGYMAGRLWTRDTMVSLLRGLAETTRETMAVINSQRRLSPLDGGVGAMAWLAAMATGARRSHKCPGSSISCPYGIRSSLPPPLYLATALLALSAAGCSAFLFAQAKGRDLWQSPLFLWHLLVQSVIAGAAMLIIISTIFQADLNLMEALRKILEISLILGLAMMLGELSLTPISEDVRRATDLLKRGALSKRFWGLGVGLGIFVPVILLLQTKCY